MFDTRTIANQQLAAYATRTDFCRLFKSGMNHLYLLSFSLTGDEEMAERCFIGGLDDSSSSNPVFKKWAESWARRKIIQNAIRMIKPQSTDNTAAGSLSDTAAVRALPAELAAIIDLPAFERFAFVISVLERYSDQDCSLLLGCAPADVSAARVRALQRVGDAAEARRSRLSIDSGKALPDSFESATPLEGFSALAVSA
jgi:DNA-directed RNA polymerase specialized sigma24 family protein